MRTAILMLSCRDYEAFELSLACHSKYLPDDVPVYILQNCRGDYDAERTLGVGRRYAYLFPNKFYVIEDVVPGPPYQSIKTLLHRKDFEQFDLICKVDDDAFPVTEGWLDKLIATYLKYDEAKSGNLAYVSPLINNNNWGFAKVIEVIGLKDLYYNPCLGAPRKADHFGAPR